MLTFDQQNNYEITLIKIKSILNTCKHIIMPHANTHW